MQQWNCINCIHSLFVENYRPFHYEINFLLIEEIYIISIYIHQIDNQRKKKKKEREREKITCRVPSFSSIFDKYNKRKNTIKRKQTTRERKKIRIRIDSWDCELCNGSDWMENFRFFANDMKTTYSILFSRINISAGFARK